MKDALTGSRYVIRYGCMGIKWNFLFWAKRALIVLLQRKLRFFQPSTCAPQRLITCLIFRSFQELLFRPLIVLCCFLRKLSRSYLAFSLQENFFFTQREYSVLRFGSMSKFQLKLAISSVHQSIFEFYAAFLYYLTVKQTSDWEFSSLHEAIRVVVFNSHWLPLGHS